MKKKEMIVPTLAVTVSQCCTTGNGGGKSQACPDENFYKALNAVHGESATAEMQLALSRSQSIDDLDASNDSDPHEEVGSDESEQHSGKVVLPPQ